MAREAGCGVKSSERAGTQSDTSSSANYDNENGTHNCNTTAIPKYPTVYSKRRIAVVQGSIKYSYIVINIKYDSTYTPREGAGGEGVSII